MNLARITTIFLVVLIGLLTAQAGQAQPFTFTTLATFDGTHGGNPDLMTLVQGFDGNLYGTTHNGGTSAKGVVFELSGGALTVKHNFTGVAPDGEYPAAGLLLATSGNFYGTTELGGANSAGTVFELTAHGMFLLKHSFTGLDGWVPDAPLIQVGGSFYGTTAAGGNSQGNVFKMSGAGAVTSLYSFTGFPDGAVPRAPLLRGFDGNFYSTTEEGGTLGTSGGAVFELNTHSKETILQSFTNNAPYGGLVQGPDGSFYGTTMMGGPSNAGTIFKISADGKTLTPLHNFGQNNNDGALPFSGLVFGSDGNLYGTTSAGIGRGNAFGTIYRISPDGINFEILYPFTNKTDGMYPTGGLLQGTDGSFYGTTDRGGIASSACPDGGTCGVVFQFSVGLPPLVKSLPEHGKAGNPIIILGDSLLGSTAVSFNGTPAVFHVVSAKEITTSVPAGATSGFITVTTPGAVLQSNVPFHVP